MLFVVDVLRFEFAVDLVALDGDLSHFAAADFLFKIGLGYLMS
jgi:hypothetical protein